jgi:ABC-type Mn2+/Zn2+ transport system ATPase subunit
MKDAEFQWTPDSQPLADLNLKVQQGEFVMVVGSVGAGKSTFVSAVLGEVNPTKGKVSVYGSIAYVPQQVTTPKANEMNNCKCSILNSSFHNRLGL